MDQQKPPAISSNYVPFTFQKAAGIPDQNQQQQQNKNTSSWGSAGTNTSTSNMAGWFGTTTTGGDCGSGSTTTPKIGLGWGSSTTTTTPATGLGWGSTTTTTPATRPGWGATTTTPATGVNWGGPTTGVGGNDYNQLKVAALEAKNQMLEGRLENQELKTQVLALTIQNTQLEAKTRELEEKMKKGQMGTLPVLMGNVNVNRWNGSNPNVQIFPNGLSVNNAQQFKQHVFAEQGFTISAGSRAATYYEVTQTSTGPGFNVGFSPGFIPDGKSLGESPNTYALQNADLCHISGVEHQFQWPIGTTKPEWKGRGDIDGCGLLRNADNKLAIFFTMNGILIGAPILISPTVDRLYPTVAIHGNVSVEANFGENRVVKPFKFELDKYLASVFG